MRYNLRSKLSLSYVLIILVSVGLISLLSNIFLEKQFQNYMITQQERKTNEMIDLISQQYGTDGSWKIQHLETIGMHALENGLIIKVLNKNNDTIWDATEHNNGLCQQMIYNIRENMFSYYANWNGEYVEKEFPISLGNETIGILKTGYLGPFYFNDDDLTFINTLNRVFVIIGLLSLIFAFILGAIMSKRISKPISNVIDKAHQLSEGKYGDIILTSSNTKEINSLIESVNSLADTLKKQEELRKRLTQDVAHELRTPLTSVQGHMEAMIDGIWEADKERLQSCYDEILRIKRLIGSIESLTRIESENLKLNKEKFDVSRLIQSIINNFEKDLETKNVKIHFENMRNDITADKDKLSQVFINLISNALKYTEPGGDIYISVTNKDNIIKLVIQDNGIGISDEDLPYIFERFYRTDKSRSKETGGIGIGLTIVKTIVNAHNGTITVESKKNEGTKFTIQLP